MHPLPSAPRHVAGHAPLAALLAPALFAAAGAQAQDDESVPGGQDQVSTAMVALLAAVVTVFVFIAAATVYLRHCSGYALRSSRSSPDDGRRGVVGQSLDAFFFSRSWGFQFQRRHGSRGLDAEAIEAFPTMRYAEAKALRLGKGGELECAVCLSEFEDEERLRLLLPRCCHAFHPDCIDEWLASHVTCPVCRCNLEPTVTTDSGEPTASFPTIPLASSISSETAVAAWQDHGQLPVAVVIDVVTAEEEQERRQEALDLQRIGNQRRARRSRSGQLAPSHSTGDTLAARLDRDLERFTLRLPEHVRAEMVAAAAEHSLQLRRGRRASEGSGRSAPLVGRWQSLLESTFFSGKLTFFSASRITVVASEGEVSSSSSYTRLRGKRVAAIDVPDEEVPANGSTHLDAGTGVGGSMCGGKDGAASREAAAAEDEEKAATQKVRT